LKREPGYALPIESRGGDSTAQVPDAISDARASESVAVLRGATVDVNTQRVVHFVLALLAVALASLSFTFFVSGLHHNTNITNLQRHGVTVSVTVSTCDGELGGSGSNLADYRCVGTFTLKGHLYNSTIPGHELRAVGSTSTFLTPSNSPGLLATLREVKGEKASWSVFILPSAFLLATLATVAVLARRHSRSSAGT
jgi:hypothetical protein